MLPTAVVPTPQGDATITVDAPAGMPRALLVLGHGAGGTVSSADLVAVTAAAVAAGYAVVRVTQPYRVAGRKAPPRPPVLDEAWLAVLATLSVPGLPLVVGGRSSGARVACRTADRLGAAAVVTLAFPTAPPRTPEKDRLAELAAPTVPVLVVQGERDPFGVPPAAPGRTVVLLPGATHTIRGTAATAAATAVLTWLDQVLPQLPSTPAAYLVAADLPGSLSIMPAPPGGAALDGALADLRADVLVSLLPPDQAAALDLADEPAAADRAGLTYRALPIPDFGVPDRAAAEPVLAALTDDLAAGRHVLVHCWGGVGRSGLVAAALLVRLGATPADAWTRVSTARGREVPETDAQRGWLAP